MKIWGKLLLFYVFAMLVIGYAFQTTYKHFRVDALNQRTETQQIAYSSVLHSNRILADTFFNEVLNREEILSLVQQIVHSEGDEQRILRGLLHRSLSATYQRSKKEVAEILHFHFLDNHTMLRFHQPQKIDDDLTEIRPSVVLANNLIQAFHGYETGRYFQAYRHIYPLLYHGKHIGLVEVSSPYYEISRKVQQLETASQTQFVFFQKKAGVFEKLFKGQEKYYVPSELHQDFVRYNNIPELLPSQEQREIVSSEIQSLLKNLKTDDQVQSNMSQGLAFSQSINKNNKYFSVVFHPVLNLSDENSGYLVGITPEPQAQKLVDQFSIYYFLTGIILLAILVYRGTLQSDLLKKKKTEVSLQAFFDNKLIGMVYLDAEGFYQQVNRQWEIMTGYSRDELLTMNFRDLTHPDELKQTLLIEQLAESGGHQTLQRTKRYVRKDGSIFWGNLSGTGLYDKHNHMTGLVGIINDITESKKLEESLAEANTIINRSPAVAFLWRNEDGWPVEFVSENVNKVLGYSSQDILTGKINYIEMIHSDDTERVKEEVVINSQKKESNAFNHAPYRIRAENGEVKWINDTTYIRRNTLGEITHYEGVLYDITDLKKVEDELSKHKMQLEALVKEQTMELEEKVMELERMNALFVGREFRIKELRDKINGLERDQEDP